MDRESLAALIEDKSDDRINEAVTEMGVEPVLGKVFEAMQARFNPDKAAGQSAVMQWDVTAPDAVHTYQVKVADGSCTVAEGAPETARVTLGMALPDFLRFVAGKLDGMQAFMTGKLKLSGDMMFAQSMQSWFTS